MQYNSSDPRAAFWLSAARDERVSTDLTRLGDLCGSNDVTIQRFNVSASRTLMAALSSRASRLPSRSLPEAGQADSSRRSLGVDGSVGEGGSSLEVVHNQE